MKLWMLVEDTNNYHLFINTLFRMDTIHHKKIQLPLDCPIMFLTQRKKIWLLSLR